MVIGFLFCLLCLLFAAYILYYFCVCLYDAIRPLGCDVMLLKSYHIISMMVFHKKKDVKEYRTGYATEDQPITSFVLKAAMLSD